MTDQANGQGGNPPEGQNGQVAEVTTPAEETVTLTAAELADYKAAKADIDEAKRVLAEVGYNNVDDITGGIKVLSRIAGEKVEAEATQAAVDNATGKTPPAPPKPAEPKPDPAIAAATEMSERAFVSAQFARYAYGEITKPEAERSVIPEKELMDAVYGPEQPVIAHLMRSDKKGERFGGNIFNAAAYLIKVTKGTTAASAKTTPAPPNPAIKAAEASASATAGASVPGSTTGEAKPDSWETIVPRTPYEPGT